MRPGLGYRPSPHDPRDQKFGALMRAGAVPTRSSGLQAFASITNQADSEGCVGWSLSGCLWTRWNSLSLSVTAPARVARPSAMFPWWLARKLNGASTQNEGTYLRDAIKQVAKVGICSDAHWQSEPPTEELAGVPRFALEPSVEAFQHAADQRFPLGYSRVGDLLSERQGQFSQALAAGYPIQIGTQVTTAFLALGPHDPVPRPKATDEIAGGHAMQVTHFDELGCYGPGTWGPDWGNAGWFALSWDYVLWPYTQDCWAIDASLPVAWS